MTTEHTYPSEHGPGTSVFTDLGWAILDHIKPGVIPDEVRAYLCGLIAGAAGKAYEIGREGGSIELIADHAKALRE